ncbi:oxygen tolerance protein BatD [Paracoccus sulfuroxidans]|uniref:Oxygen tolerance protein BatD n=2 Tax=Paracoccus sulfuroxidans TaxID=384678 RepID=A0A562NFR0_9RHOB|nr:oxygen tolerance protein BatD [Paracoccus sulfuroxidans]
MVMLRALLLFLLLPFAALAQDQLRLVAPEFRPVVGEMIPITIRGEYTGAIALSEMTFPNSEGYDWIQYAPDRWFKERIDGKLLQIFERRIAVFPRRTGGLTVGPVSHQMTKSDGAAREQVVVEAPAISFSVTAYPGHGRPLSASSLAVTDELSTDPAQLRNGETFTRKITLTAKGAMAHLLPERPQIREKWLISFAAPELRETRLTPDGPVAFVSWEWSLRPHTGEQGALEPLRFSFFNTSIREMRGAITQPVQIGLTGFGNNVAGTSRPPARTLALIALTFGTALLVGVVLSLLGRRPGRRAASALIARLRLDPVRVALREAAASGNAFRLQAAAHDYARALRQRGWALDPALLRELDAAIYGENPRSVDVGQFGQRLLARKARNPIPSGA